MNSISVPPPIPANIGSSVLGTDTTNAAPPPMPGGQVSNGPAPPPIPTNVGSPVLSGPQEQASQSATANGPPPRGGILRNVAAGALDLPQEIADVGKWALGNLSQAGAGVAMGADPSQLGTSELTEKNVQPADTGAANIPWVTKFIQGTSATSLPEKMARGAGEMLPFAIAPEAGGAGLLTRGAQAVGLGAASGAGGYAGRNLAPFVGLTPEEGDFWGSLIGGGLSAAGKMAASKIGLGGEGLAEIAPVTSKQQQQYVAAKIRQFAPQAEQQLQAAKNVTSAVPGSTLSAAQAAKSPELARLESALQQTSQGTDLAEQQVNQAQKRADFLEKQQFTPDQQKAEGITGVSPVAGIPSNLSDYIADARLQDEAATTTPINIAEQSRAAGLNEPLLTSPKPVAPKLASVANAPEQEHQIPLQSTLSAGEQIRQVAKQKLYNTMEQINPSMDLSPLNKTVSSIQNFMEQRGFQPRHLGPGEGDLYSEAQSIASKPTTWLEADGFRQRINEALDKSYDPDTKRPTLLTRRLQILKQGVDNAVNTAADREVQAAPEVYAPTLAEQARLYMQAKTADERQAILESGSGPSVRPTSLQRPYQQPGGTSGISAAPGTAGAGETGLPNAPSVSGMAERGAEGGINPSITQEHIDTYRQALKAHAQQMGLYWKNKYIGKMLAPDVGGNFRMPSDQVVQAALPGGKSSREVAMLMRKIGETNPAALDAYGQAIALNLRKAAVKNGVDVDQNALERWKNNHSGMLSVFPEIAQKIKNIGGAQDMVEKATAAKNAAMDVYNHKAITQLLNGTSPEEAMDTVMNGTSDQARQFMEKIKGNPQAVAGARTAAANNFINRYIKPTAGENDDVRIGKLDQLLTSPRAKANMKTVFGPHFEEALRTISADEKLTNTRALMRKAGDSPTAFYREAIEQLNAPTTYLGQMIRHFNPLDAMVAMGDSHGMIGRSGAAALGGWLRNFSANRTAAAQRVLAKTLTSPEATAQALQRYIPRPGAMNQFTRSMAKTFAAQQSAQQESQ